MSETYPIGVDAINVDMANGNNLEEEINKIPYYYNSVADMKADEKLEVGDMAITLGYYEANDGGAGEYIIIDEESSPDNGFIIKLDNNFKAKFLIKNNEVNLRQLGGKSENDTNYSHYDNKNNLKIYLDYIKLINHKKGTIKLFIPAGIWCFSETFVDNRNGINIVGQNGYIIAPENTNGTTIITCVNNNQDYIWKIGCNSDFDYTVSSFSSWNVNLDNLIFSSGVFDGDEVSTVYHINKSALYLDGIISSRFGFLQFDNISGTALAISTSWELYFDKLNFRRIYDFNTPAMLFDAIHSINGANSPDISAVCIDEIMFEGINGDCIESKLNSNLSELQINQMNIECRLVKYAGTENGTIINNNTDTTNFDYHYSVFKIGRALGTTINSITLSNMNNYVFIETGTGKKHIMDRIFTYEENAFTMIIVNSITNKFNKVKTTLLYKDTENEVNFRSRLIVNNWIGYQEALYSNTPLVDVQYLNQIQVDNIESGMANDNQRYNPLNSYPLYEFAWKATNDNRICYDETCKNKLKLGVRRRFGTTVQNLAILRYNQYYNIAVRVKIKEGISSRISYRGTAIGSSESYISGPTYVGTGDWQWVIVPLANNLQEGTRIVLMDANSNYQNEDEMPIFDCIIPIPKTIE